MKTKITPSAYDQPCRITSWGYAFDSLTELKYAVSIMEEYEFMREPVCLIYSINRYCLQKQSACYRDSMMVY